MKILILVLSCDSNPLYRELANTIKNTWGNHKSEDVTIIYYSYKDNIPDTYIEKSLIGTNNYDLYLKGVEKFDSIGKKTIDCFKYILKNNYEFDYIFRTNLSSYINIKEMLLFMKNKQKSNYCSAIIGKYGEIKYPSGCGYFLSNDLVNLVVNNEHLLKHQYIDDVALGDLLMQLNIPIQNDAKRIDIIDESLHYLVDTKNYHYRCKHEKNRKLDKYILEILNSKYNS